MDRQQKAQAGDEKTAKAATDVQAAAAAAVKWFDELPVEQMLQHELSARQAAVADACVAGSAGTGTVAQVAAAVEQEALQCTSNPFP